MKNFSAFSYVQPTSAMLPYPIFIKPNFNAALLHLLFSAFFILQ